MANFKDAPLFSTHDDYYTPLSAWKNIVPFIKNKNFNKVFECFLLNSNEQSKRNLETLGFQVIGNKKVDFLNEETFTEEMKNKDYDIIISNPPFQRIKSFQQRKENLKYKCIKKLFDNDKPFIILLNSTNIFQKWFKELTENKDIKFIFPSKKIEYDKYEEGGEKIIYNKTDYWKKIQKEKGYRLKKQMTQEEKDYMNNLDKEGSCSFNSIYVCYKVLDKNEWI